MARNMKQGVDYFPLDVHIDNKLKFIKIKYGVKGFGVMVYLLQHIYSLSYWCSCTEDDVLLLSDEFKVDHSFLIEVIAEALRRNFFNQELYEKHSILTSKGIQKRYKEIVKRRKDVEIVNEYLLIDNNLGLNVTVVEKKADDVQAPIVPDADDEKKPEEKKKPTKRFAPPSIEEVTKYCNQRKNNVDPSKFINFYESKGWMVGKNKMKDWKASVRTWESKDKPAAKSDKNSKIHNSKMRDSEYTNDQLKQKLAAKEEKKKLDQDNESKVKVPAAGSEKKETVSEMLKRVAEEKKARGE